VGIEIASLTYKSFKRNSVAPPPFLIGAFWSQIRGETDANADRAFRIGNLKIELLNDTNVYLLLKFPNNEVLVV
jgi:hypothetical protein